MIDRRVLLAIMIAAPSVALAQNRRFRIGWLTFGGTTLGPIDQTLLDALLERGVVPGRNVDIEFRYANGRLAAVPTLAAELVAQKPDLLVTIGGDLVAALNIANPGRIPIVGGVSDNPIRTGLATTFARPGKNFTGVAYLTDDLAGKRIELLKELVPGAQHTATIWNPQHVDDEFVFARRAAEKLGLALSSHQVGNVEDLNVAFHQIENSNADSIFVIPSRFTADAIERIAPFARNRRLPVVTAWREMVSGGCTLSYGPSRSREARRLADMVVKILSGAKAGDIPIEQPSQFELVINLKAAKAIDLAVSEALLLRANEVIE
jgi:putative tryptophan/tyrosine transport system substrate-binding protein